MKKSALVLAFTVSAGTPVFAQDVYYVNDQLTITVRSGESTSHQILRTLKSGAKLSIIKRHKETGYSLAILEDGSEGWVLTRFLTKSPIARDQLKTAQANLKSIQTQLNTTENELREIRKAYKIADSAQSTLTENTKALSQELERIRRTSANAIALDEENKELKTELIHLETEVQSLEQQNAVLQDNSARNWFITGTGVTLLGILIGLIAPKLRMQKKNSWSEL